LLIKGKHGVAVYLSAAQQEDAAGQNDFVSFL
jgi:hypothetical protein